jgi:hypothetical protein
MAFDSRSAQRFQRPVAAKSRLKGSTAKRRNATHNVKPRPDHVRAKCSASRRVDAGARESQLAVACYRRASRWADAVREGLDPDIARFIRDQAAAWQLIANELAGRGG